MKSRYLLSLLCLFPLLALADIYKSVDVDGHITYSSAPLKGGKRIIETQTPNRTSSAVRSRPAAAHEDFPSVNKEMQRGRDATRRKILEDELKIEQTLLGEAQRGLRAVEVNPKTASNNDKLKDITSQVELHQQNIDALNSEISKLK